METLIKKLYNHNVIFSYYGFFDDKVLEQVLLITKSKLESNQETGLVISRVHDALNNCIDNIVSHNFYPDDERLHYKSLLIVSKHGDNYHIDALNVVNDKQKEIIDRQLNFLGSHSRTELLELVTNNSSNGKATVNASIISMVLKADHYNCSYKQVGEHYLFNINFQISTRQMPVNIEG
jgi:hypothetical protein